MGLEGKSDKDDVIINDLQAQVYMRSAKSLADAGSFSDSISELETLIEFVDKLDRAYIDRTFVMHISRTRNTIIPGLEQYAAVQLQSRLQSIIQWFDNFLSSPLELSTRAAIMGDGRKKLSFADVERR